MLHRTLVIILLITNITFAQIPEIQKLSQKDIEFRKLYSEAIKLYLNEDWDKAIQTLHKCIEIKPNSAAAHFILAKIYLQNDQPSKAINELKTAIELNPNNYWYHKLLAQTFAKYGYINYAIEQYIEATKIQKFPEDLITITKLYLSKLDTNSAIKWANKYINSFGLDKNIGNLLTKIYIKQKDTTNATKIIAQLMKIYPNDPQLNKLYFSLTSKNLSIQQIINLYQQNNINTPQLLHQLFNYYLNIENSDSAYIIAKDIIQSEDFSENQKLQIIAKLKQKTNHDSVITLLKRLFTKNPINQNICNAYANVLFEQFYLNKALQILYHCLENAPYELSNYLILTDLLLLTENYKLLDSITSKAITIFPTLPKFYALKAIAILKNSQNVDLANFFINQAITFDVSGLEKPFITLAKILEAIYRNNIDFAQNLLNIEIKNIQNNCFFLTYYMVVLKEYNLPQLKLIDKYLSLCVLDSRAYYAKFLYAIQQNDITTAKQILELIPILKHYNKTIQLIKNE